jgi:UDP-GlcNAc:undecaprenyl-phosphate GlcNAc-1-phosphate transferase
MTEVLLALLVPAVAAGATALLTPMVRAVAMRGGQVAGATEDRWHTRPTPNVGGLAIVGGFALAVALEVGLFQFRSVVVEVAPQAVVPVTPPVGLVAASLLAFALGLWDDLRPLRPSHKLIGQLTAASLLIMTGIGVWLTGFYVLDVLISLFWFVGITNALNLLDNMDGLAGGIGAIAAVFLGIDFLLSGQFELGILAFAFAAALGGFLTHNYPPARIFMGDSGSLFIGMFLAGLALSPAPGLSRSLAVVVAVPLIVLAIPILDTSYVTMTRLLEGRAVSQGGRDHTSHSLVDLGVSEERALWILWGLAALGGGIGLLVRTASRSFAYVLVLLLVGVLVALGSYLLTSRLDKLETDRSEGTKATLLERVGALHQRLPFLVFGMDIFVVVLSYYAAYLIRWDSGQLPAELAYLQRTLVVVVALKLMAFTGAAAYSPRWRHYSISDAMIMVKANLFGTLLTASALFLVARSGLSRGVLLVDFLVCTVLTVVGRFSFRLLEDATGRWSVEGKPVAFVGGVQDADLAIRAARVLHGPGLRIVAVVDHSEGRSRGRFQGYPVFGGRDGIARAVGDSGVHAVVVLDKGQGTDSHREFLTEHLANVGAVDVYVLRVSLEPASQG